MDIGPIFRALFHHKSRFWLITLEIALTLAIVANCVNMILDERARILRPTGMDEENLVYVGSAPFAPEFEDEDYTQASYEEDLRMIRALPGVRAATGASSIPLSSSGSGRGRRPAGTDAEVVVVPVIWVGTDALETLGAELAEGRRFVDDDFAEDSPEEGDDPPTRNVILTRAMADVLFPDGDALGRQIDSGTESPVETIVGIIGQMQSHWPQSPWAERVMLLPGRPGGPRGVRYLVRAEPGMIDDLYTSLETELLRVNEGRIVTVRTLEEIKADTYRSNMVVIQMLGGVSLLLVMVSSLGVIGLTSFSVTQRTREIGTRRALGATRLAILRYFLVENWIVTSAGLALGLVLTLVLNFALAQWADVSRIAWTHVAGGMVLLWVVGLLATLVPALRGTAVPPVVATRTV